MLICYETYRTPQAKRKAQRGAFRGKTTGQAQDYILVDTKDRTHNGYGAIAPIYEQEVGSDCLGLAYCSIGWEFLRTRCRKIGRASMPKQWRDSFNRYLE